MCSIHVTHQSTCMNILRLICHDVISRVYVYVCIYINIYIYTYICIYIYQRILLRWRHGRSAAIFSCRWTDVWHECCTWTRHVSHINNSCGTRELFIPMMHPHPYEIMWLSRQSVTLSYMDVSLKSFTHVSSFSYVWCKSHQWDNVTDWCDLHQTYENDETCVNDLSETYENIVSFIGLFCKRDRRHSRCVTVHTNDASSSIWVNNACRMLDMYRDAR